MNTQALWLRINALEGDVLNLVQEAKRMQQLLEVDRAVIKKLAIALATTTSSLILNDHAAAQDVIDEITTAFQEGTIGNESDGENAD